MEFLYPFKGALKNFDKDRVLHQPLACPAAPGSGPFRDKLCQITFQHLASLRLSEHDRMLQLHALREQGRCRECGRIAVLDPLLDLEVDCIELFHRRVFRVSVP